MGLRNILIRYTAGVLTIPGCDSQSAHLPSHPLLHPGYLSNILGSCDDVSF